MEEKIAIIFHTEQRKVSDLIPYEHNPRKMTEEQAEQLKRSLVKFNLSSIPVINIDNILISGHQRMKIMKILGRGDEVIDVRVPNRLLDENEVKELNIRENKNLGEFDFDILANAFDLDMLLDVGFSKGEFGLDAFQINEAKGKLSERFIVPPFSVLDTRQGYWQDRKRLWLSIMPDLESTREETLFKVSDTHFSKVSKEIGTTSHFDPVLAEIMCRWFCKAGGKILDPFAGEPTKGVVAGFLGYSYQGIEIREEQTQADKEACIEYPKVQFFTGDANNIDQIITDADFDFIFTSPPYYDLEVYSREDMSALGTYEEFMKQYAEILSKCVARLKDGSFVVLKLGEIRAKKNGVYRNFIGDTIQILNGLGLHYYNEIIFISWRYS